MRIAARFATAAIGGRVLPGVIGKDWQRGTIRSTRSYDLREAQS